MNLISYCFACLQDAPEAETKKVSRADSSTFEAAATAGASGKATSLPAQKSQVSRWTPAGGWVAPRLMISSGYIMA